VITAFQEETGILRKKRSHLRSKKIHSQKEKNTIKLFRVNRPLMTFRSRITPFLHPWSNWKDNLRMKENRFKNLKKC
jgi:hypothetical protein